MIEPVSAHRSEELRSRDERCQIRVELDGRAQVKIANLHRQQRLRIGTQDVLRLQIPVRNAL